MKIADKKRENVILFFANQSPNKSIEKVKLMKLIWLSDKLHLNKYGRLILQEHYKAMPNGLVPIVAYAQIPKKIDHNTYEVIEKYVKAKRNETTDFFSKSDIEIMLYVWKKFGTMTSEELSEYSHKFPEWLRHEKSLSLTNMPNAYDIDEEDLFKFPIDETFEDLLAPQEIELSKKTFLSHKTIQSFLNS